MNSQEAISADHDANIFQNKPKIVKVKDMRLKFCVVVY